MPFSTLIGVDDLAAHIGDPDWVIVDCRFTLSDPSAGEIAYAKTRLPGARYAHLERDLSGPRRPGLGRNPLPEPATLGQTLGDWGIGPNTQVVVYDDSFGSIACRLWWLLRWAGHRSVALLDGGWPAWKRKRLPIEESTPARPMAAMAPYPTHPDGMMLAETPLIEEIRTATHWALLDARPEDRYTGERETVDPVAGHIPGSRFFTFEDNLDFDGSFLGKKDLRARFLGTLGEVAPDHVVHTCGSGVTACHNLLAMEHIGLTGSRLHAGSWSEWITDPVRPVATGQD